MKLLEYEAKQLLEQSHFPTPSSELLRSKDDLPSFYPVVLKSQVLSGGRGKQGGVIIQEYQDKDQIAGLFSHSINGLLPICLLAEEKLSIKQEFYFSLFVDRATQSINLLVSKNGGVDVEEADPDSFEKIIISHDTIPAIGERIAEIYNTPDKSFLLQEIFEKAFKCFTSNDGTLLEINPLVLTVNSEIIAGDCKMTVDDAAAFRHPDWDFSDRKADNNFVILDTKGTVATVANGAGLAMATVDAVAAANLAPANFLDIGGGANEASVLAAFEKIMEFPNINAVVINIFAGITRCDEVAKAIIAATRRIPNLPKLYIRLAGTNYKEAKVLLGNHNLALLPSLDACIAAIVAKEDL